jgi:hypothetical protein
MSKSATSFFSIGRKTFLMFGAVLGLAASGLVANSTNAQTPTPTPTPNPRIIRATTTAVPSSAQAQTATINIQLDSQGDEASASYTINYNQAVLSNPQVALGNGVPAGAVLSTNTNQSAQGRLGILIDSTNTYAAGTRNMATVTFTVAAGAAIAQYPVTFSDTPTLRTVSNAAGALVPAQFVSGFVQVGNTAAGARVSGRIVTPDGRGIRNATVVLTDTAGNRRVATTSSFGIYTFEDVETGQNYVIGVISKQYRFAARSIQIVDSLTDFDFVGQQ